ncbi:quinic acid utilization activator [Pyrenophora seminiperda CCB06]|uniref:Quinic acid utilization activator n=1 Tax=Pyrenophora seminiperda CCB06 TaxID=1302712 RepID=A0A3M7MDE6_9PLEO|nr:quinic acid utilization activator [Pyrenophora seminiperda CCB06]
MDRVSRACDQCRTAREKCDANQPTCMPCVENKRACSYTSTPKKRGLQPGYIRSLEMTLAFVFQQNPEMEVLAYNQLAQSNTVLLARGTKESNQLHKSWNKSRFCRDVTKALSGEQIGTGNDRPPSSDEDSEVDTEDASLLRMTTDAQSYSSNSWNSNANFMPNAMAPPSLPDVYAHTPQEPMLPPNLTPLPPGCWKLIETYFTYTQCWLPIADKLEVLKLSYSYPEHGLPLSCDMPSSGSHAEMWSILAVGSVQDGGSLAGEHRQNVPPSELYDTARLLIPNELGKFELDHVKALLNLSVLNITRGLFETAWQLVGIALRIFFTLAEPSEVAVPRRKNVLSSCFMLDNLLSLHLKLRPYLERVDLTYMGKIEEDGMEEWQPWGGQLSLGLMRQSNSPTLALSSFNACLELVDILGSTTRQQTAPNFLHEMISRLEMWKSSLPQRLNHIHKDTAVTPLTPPALLLRLTYFVTAFALVPSQAWLEQTLDVLGTLEQLGTLRAPPIIACLLQQVKRSSERLTLDQITHARLCRSLVAFDQTTKSSQDTLNNLHSTPHSMDDASPSTANMMQTSPQSFPPHISGPYPERFHPRAGTSAILDNMLPDMRAPPQGQAPPSFSQSPFDHAMAGSFLDPHDPYHTLVSGDLGNFLDDFASEHGAKKLRNQPQFMENLGFSSNVSMADLLAADPSRFMPTASQVNNEDSPRFPPNAFYEAG